MCPPIHGEGLKIIFTIIELLGNKDDYLMYPPTLKLQCLGLCFKGFPILFSTTRSNPVSPFPEDIIRMNFKLSEEDGMISHNLLNLVSGSLK